MFDAVNLKAVAVIPAHDSPLAALAFNSTGTKLASASTTVSSNSAHIMVLEIVDSKRCTVPSAIYCTAGNFIGFYFCGLKTKFNPLKSRQALVTMMICSGHTTKIRPRKYALRPDKNLTQRNFPLYSK